MNDVKVSDWMYDALLFNISELMCNDGKITYKTIYPESKRVSKIIFENSDIIAKHFDEIVRTQEK